RHLQPSNLYSFFSSGLFHECQHKNIDHITHGSFRRKIFSDNPKARPQDAILREQGLRIKSLA
ncbi:hypothetical protein, partial [Flagellimonas amphidinii]|uniref:hypothetical protein n=1 Tax=Flagellimonas amphidinii TaxID=2735167 RepID=UPI001C0ECC76